MFEARFQTFEDISERAQSAARVTALRAGARGRKGSTVSWCQGPIVSRTSICPASHERLAWLTGFTGSAGFAIVLTEQAVIFVDGRYTVQAEAQVDKSVFAIEHLVDAPASQWLERNAAERQPRSATIPGCTPARAPSRFKAACAKAGAELVAVTDNPIDALWQERPAPPSAPVEPARRRIRRRERGRQAQARAGRARAPARRRAGHFGCAEPRLDLQHPRRRRGAHAAGARLRAGAARGQAHALHRARQARATKCATRSNRSPTCARPTRLEGDLAKLGGKSVLLDQASAADTLTRLIADNGGKPTRGADPITLMKAVKNHAEIAGARAAHKRDGAAVDALSLLGSTARRRAAS